MLIDDEMPVKHVNKFICLGTYFDKNGLGETEIKFQIHPRRKIMGYLNSLWRDKNICNNYKIRVDRIRD